MGNAKLRTDDPKRLGSPITDSLERCAKLLLEAFEAMNTLDARLGRVLASVPPDPRTSGGGPVPPGTSEMLTRVVELGEGLRSLTKRIHETAERVEL